MERKFLVISAIVGALGVILGAFGAHGLKNILSEELLKTYNTGILYHLIHSVVLLSISINTKYDLIIPFFLILSGILLFSFSLYLYALTQIKFLVFITPIGGISFVLGWISIIYSVYKKKS